MSDCMTLRCATCDEDSPFLDENRGTYLREMAEAAPVFKLVNTLPSSSWFVCYITQWGHTFGIEWLAEHAGHELVLVSECGPVVWSSKTGDVKR